MRKPCCDKVDKNKGAWSKQEDEKLIDYIKAHGEGCWRSLPQAAGLLNRHRERMKRNYHDVKTWFVTDIKGHICQVLFPWKTLKSVSFFMALWKDHVCNYPFSMEKYSFMFYFRHFFFLLHNGSSHPTISSKVRKFLVHGKNEWRVESSTLSSKARKFLSFTEKNEWRVKVAKYDQRFWMEEKIENLWVVIFLLSLECFGCQYNYKLKYKVWKNGVEIHFDFRPNLLEKNGTGNVQNLYMHGWGLTKY